MTSFEINQIIYQLRTSIVKEDTYHARFILSSLTSDDISAILTQLRNFAFPIFNTRMASYGFKNDTEVIFDFIESFLKEFNINVHDNGPFQNITISQL